MRLRKIEVSGFKSFADRQVIQVDERITGVIGPNGCGKSNIVDAVRWSMGEQSAKHLRGAGMADVIFAGCSTRGPAGMAEVTLTFDNTGDFRNAHYEMPEIGITRRLFADGTSEYLINKVPGRLRDITELLMGTGAGTKGYSIIEQGQVGKIVSSKPEERRHIIDEAAGITRFKSQKAAAQRKIEATRQNLLRVTDVVGELEGRLGTLRRQAQKAERYKRYRDELRDLDLWIASHKYLELVTTGRVLRERHERLSTQVADLRASIDTRDTQIEARRLAIAEVERELAEHQQSVYDLDNRVKLLEAEEEYRRRERASLAASATQSRAEADAAQHGLTSVETELELTDAELERIGVGAQGDAGRAEELVGELAELDDELVRLDETLERDRLAKSAAQETIASAQARLEALEERRGELAARGESLTEQRAEHGAQTADAAREAEEARAAVERAHTALDGLRQRKAALERQRAELREEVGAAEVGLDTRRAEVHRCRSRLQSLQEIQKRYRGCASGVQVVMERADELAAGDARVSTDGSVASQGGEGPRGPVLGVLADYLDAPAHLEAAVSAVLGDALEGVVVDDAAAAARGVALLKREQEGRTTFLPRGVVHSPPPSPSPAPAPSPGDEPGAAESSSTQAPAPWGATWASPERPEPVRGPFEVVDLSDSPQSPEREPTPTERAAKEPGVLGRLADLVSLGGELRDLARVLLGDTLVVEDLATGLELWRRHGEGLAIVTTDGDRIEPTGVIIGGSPTALDSALLKQKREIGELEEILAELETEFQDTRRRHQGLAERLALVERERDEAEGAVLEAEKDNLAAAQGLHQAEARQQTLSQQGETLQRDEADLAQRRDAHGQEVATRTEAQQVAQAEVTRLEAELATQATRRADGRAGREALATRVTEAKVAHARWQQQRDALTETRERLSKQASSERDRIMRLRASADEAEAKAKALDDQDEAARQERAQLVEDSRAATSRVHDARERHDALRVGLDELEASVKTLRGDLDGERERLQEVTLGLQESDLERSHVEQDVARRFDTALTEVLIDFHDRPRAGADERSRQKDLARLLSRMGEVNLTAIDEFEEVQERFEYLRGQKDDLEQAIEQLQEAIDKINKTTRQLFREAFHAINDRFQDLFPRLFNGGRAQLQLTDPSDMLATGVEIVAQPPGKQLRSLDLLSGGEKALTAVSLIFAVFLFRPSPFCILDEVDAPLDDANVGRMNKLVRELAGNTQFILITHNKVTMEHSDRLYGVTMEQRGVSKLVSVNMRRAVELAYN